MTHPFLDKVMKEIERRNYAAFNPYADEQDYSYAELYAQQVLDKHQAVLDKQDIVIKEIYTFIADTIFVKYSRSTYKNDYYKDGEIKISQLPLDDFIFFFLSIEKLRIHEIESIIND